MKKYTDIEKAVIRDKARKYFNDLPFITRCLTIPSDITTTITELEIQKKELKKMISKINNRINELYHSAEQALKEIEK